MLPSSALLFDCAHSREIAVPFVTLKPGDGDDNFGWWQKIDAESSSNEPDAHWDWKFLIHTYTGESFLATGLRSDDGRIQGAGIFQAGYESLLVEHARAVYVHRLATAPWNRTAIMGPNVKYKGAGTALAFFGMCYSYEYGFKGRIILSSLREENTLKFYKRFGFHDTGEVDAEDLPILELPDDVAKKILVQKGVIQ